MFRPRTFVVSAVAILASIAVACTDFSGPTPNVCPIGGGPGTCADSIPK